MGGGETAVCRVPVEQARAIIASQAARVVTLLKQRNLRELSRLVHPVKGVRFSPYAFLNQKANVSFTAATISGALQETRRRVWGTYQGSGARSGLRLPNTTSRFIYDRDFATASKISYNGGPLVQGNTHDNSFEEYPNAIIVENHMPGVQPAQEGMDWASLRLFLNSIGVPGTWSTWCTTSGRFRLRRSKMSQIHVRNRLRPSENVAGATVTIAGTGAIPASVSGPTNSHGVATLDTSKLANGTYTLIVTPSSTTPDPVGPAIASGPTPGDRIFRSLVVELAIVSGRIATATVSATNRPNGEATAASPSNVTVGLQPVWIRSLNHGGRGSHQITMIIVHHTGGPTIGPAINTFLSTTEQTSAHYLINTDGQIIKMVQDSKRANQAGESHWAGVNGVNTVSIGIEIVHATGAYPQAQYAALLDLIARLRRASPPSWPGTSSDIATSPQPMEY